MIIEGEEKNFFGRFFSSPLIFPTLQKSRAVTVFPIVPDYN